MSNQKSINQFFAGKFFEIPKYQRSYAWEKQNIRELFEDIKEALETNSSHYIGTVVLAKTNNPRVFNIVDGQQRITTLVMLISTIANKLSDQSDRDHRRRIYVKDMGQYKLSPLDRDKDFFFKILNDDATPEPESKSQRYMLDAYQEMTNIVNNHIQDLAIFLEAIGDLSVLEFVEEKESDAIRIFQTVNDRGRDLSRMDKIKSLLFYFSNKYLSGKYDEDINDKFGEIFELYDDIKMIGEEQKINIISSRQFSEDDLLRQHHICFSSESYDPTAQQVLSNIKLSLSEARQKEGIENLDKFISDYLESLLGYVRAFKEVVEKTRESAAYYKIFSILGLSAVYYPIITQLKKIGFLEIILPTKKISVLKMIEIIDVRVLKVREYAGKKHIAEFARSLNDDAWTIKDIEDHLLWFNSHEISNERFKDYLANYEYYKQTGLLRTFFIDYCERLRGKLYNLKDLVEIMSSEPTIEHILSQTPKFKPKTFGFKNEEDFGEHSNLLGNLTLLEKKINSTLKNDDLVEKWNGYNSSKFCMTTELATALSTTKKFNKADLLARGERLVENFSKRWWA